MHVVSVTRDEVEELKRAFSLYDVDNDGRIDVYEFSLILRSIFDDDPMFCSLLSGVIQECKKKKWVYFPDFLGVLVRNRHNPFYDEIWDRFTTVNFNYGDLGDDDDIPTIEFIHGMEFKNSLHFEFAQVNCIDRPSSLKAASLI